MTKSEGWLQLSVDHVVPQQMVALGFPGEWILDFVPSATYSRTALTRR